MGTVFWFGLYPQRDIVLEVAFPEDPAFGAAQNSGWAVCASHFKDFVI